MVGLKKVFRTAGTVHLDMVMAAAVGLAAVILFSLQILPVSQEEVSQFSKYLNAASQYINGTVAAERLPDYSPMYLWLHVAVWSLMADPPRSILVVHIILLAMTSSLLFLLLRRRSGAVISLAGVTAFIFSKSIVIYGYVFEPEPLMIFFLTSLVYFSQRRDVPGNLATGIAMALCMLTRPTFAPMIVLIPVYYKLHAPDHRMFYRSVLVFLAPVLLALVFISYRNYQLQGAFSPLGMNPAPRFFDGNNPTSEGTRAAYPALVNDVASRAYGESDYEYAVYRLFARKAAGRNLPVGETDRYWVSKATNFIVDYPNHFFLSTAKRIFYIFHGYRWHDLDPSWLLDREIGKRNFAFIPFALLSAMALLGLLAGIRAWRIYFLPYMIFLIQGGFLAIIYSTDRQRVCLYPFFILFAASWLSRLGECRRGRTLSIMTVILLAILFSYDFEQMKDDQHLWDGTRLFYNLIEKASDVQGMEYRSALRKSVLISALAPRAAERVRLSDIPLDAAETARLAVQELPSIRNEGPSTQLDRALLMIEAGELNEAENMLRSLVHEHQSFFRDGDSMPDPLYHLGRIAFLKGNNKRAAEFMRSSLLNRPGEPLPLSYLFCLTGDRRYSEAVFRYFDDLDANFYIGRACLETGRSGPALEHFSRLAAFLPDNAKILVYQAAALGAEGRYKEAAAVYINAAGEHTGTVMLEDKILPAFERWAQDGTPDAAYWYGIVLRQYGRFQEARQIQKRCAESGNADAGEEIRRLSALMNAYDLK